MIDARHFAPLGDVQRVGRTERGALLEIGDDRVRLDLVREDILRIQLARGAGFEEKPTHATCFELPERMAFEFRDSPTRCTLQTASLEISVEKRDFALNAARGDGTVLFESARDAAGRSQALRVLNDEFIVERRTQPSDSLYGLGQKTGSVERRGRQYVLWNLDVLATHARELNRLYETDLTQTPTSANFDPYYTSIPFFQHVAFGAQETRAAGFFIDNAFKSHFDFKEPERYMFRFFGGQYTEYVFAGPTLASVLEAYTFITGRMSLPPIWSLGHHQCRWHDYTDRELLEIGREYRRRNIPCDALWLDIGHMDEFRVFTWHKERFPDPRATFEQMRAEGFRSVAIVDPGIKEEPGYAVFDEARRQNLLCKTEGGALYTGQVWPGRTVFPDFSRDETRAFWAERIRDHVALGLSGVWNDMNEPATGNVEPFAMRFDRDGANHPHERYHNQYALAMALATEAGLRAALPDERPFILSRAGSAGIQRVAAQWLGDNTSSFEHLAMSISMALGMGLSGQPFIGADIPGFAGEPTEELALRWFQAGALSPFSRCHNMSGCPDQYPWSFGPAVEAIARDALSLRYRLLPYLYAAFTRASATGEPIQRPLLFDFPNDPDARARDDQFLLGEALLVAPVVAPSARSRAVYLPEGDWFDWYTGERLEGRRLYTIDAPLSKIPLFARAGYVIPMYEHAPSSTLDFFPELIELHLFAPKTAVSRTSLLYEDDGRSLRYQTGAFRRTALKLEQRGYDLHLSAQVSGDGFAECRRGRLRLVLHGMHAEAASLDGQAVFFEAGSLLIENQGQAFELAIRAGT